jgi:CRISPR-associated protein Csb1
MNPTEPSEELKTAITLLDNLLGLVARKPGAAAKLPAAIRVVEKLEPAGGMSVPVFPASYLGDEDKPAYDLNGIEYGEPLMTIRGKDKDRVVRPVLRARLCALDSPQSQANRMEPAFADDPDLAALVPQATATIPRRAGINGDENLLRLPHRVADFRVRLSDQAATVKTAIADFVSGDALALLRLMPTSILFGFWDSRGEQSKHARILLARVDAFNVVPCRRHALYSGPYSKDEFAEINLGDAARAKDKKDADKMAELGFSAAPSDGLGGVVVEDRIERLALLSLTDIARVTCKKPQNSDVDAQTLTNAARRYLFALAGLAEGYSRSTGSHRLRSGCELIATTEAGATIDLRGGATDYPDAASLKLLFKDRALLIQVAAQAKGVLGIAATLDAFNVTSDTLKAAFITPDAPAVDANAPVATPTPQTRNKRK